MTTIVQVMPRLRVRATSMQWVICLQWRIPELIAFPVLDVGQRRPDDRFPLQPDPARTGQEGQSNKEGAPDSA